VAVSTFLVCTEFLHIGLAYSVVEEHGVKGVGRKKPKKINTKEKKPRNINVNIYTYS